MIRIFVTFLTSCFCFSLSFGQSANIVLTQDQYNLWFDSLSTLPIEAQLKMISERLLKDTNVYIKQNYPDRIKITEQVGNRTLGFGKPVLIVNDISLVINNSTDTKKIVHLAKLLDKSLISHIQVFKPTEVASIVLYGAQGLNGVILMSVKKKKFLKQFKKLRITNYNIQS